MVTIIFSHFDAGNNIFTDCISPSRKILGSSFCHHTALVRLRQAMFNGRKYYWCPICKIVFGTLSKCTFFPILRKKYWTFLYCSLISYFSSNFPIAKVVALNLSASFFVQILYTAVQEPVLSTSVVTSG